MPIEWSPRASTPGSTPIEYTRTKIRARISSGRARVTTMNARAAPRTKRFLTMLFAERNAIGIARKTPSAVPANAIRKVSSAASHTSRGSSMRGVHIRLSRLMMSCRSVQKVSGFTPMSHML
jgi:hypothetical protein